MGLPFCWVDIEVAKRTTGNSSTVSFPKLLAKRPLLNTPLAVLYGSHYAATKIAGEAIKCQGDHSLSSKLYEGLAMVMVNNPGAQILNRGVIKSLQQSSKSMPAFSSGTALLLGRDLTLWCGNTIARDLTGEERWLARASIFSLTTAFHLSANMVMANQSMNQLLTLLKSPVMIPILGLRICRVALAEVVVNGPDKWFR